MYFFLQVNSLCSKGNFIFPKDVVLNYTSHGFTSKGFDNMQSIVPSFLNLTNLISNSHVVLEHGCGSARFLLEEQDKFPHVKFIGTNYVDYAAGMFGNNVIKDSQATDHPHSLLKIAHYFNTTIHCNQHGLAILPRIVLSHVSITSDKYNFQLHNASVDLIVSRDALNIGKLAQIESHAYIVKFLKLMRVGATAVLHINAYAELFWGKLTDTFAILDVFKFTYEQHMVSVVLSKVTKINWWDNFVTMVIRICKPNDTVSSVGDCILNNQVITQFGGHMRAYKSLPKPNSTVIYDNRHTQYDVPYYINLLSWLEKWQTKGFIF